MELEEEKFNQENISHLIRNILTLRYDPFQTTPLQTLGSSDFYPQKNLI